MKTMVWMSFSISFAAVWRAGVSADWRIPNSRLTIGGLYRMKVFAAVGAPLRSINAKGRSTRRSACSRGLATVAEQQMNTGSTP